MMSNPMRARRRTLLTGAAAAATLGAAAACGDDKAAGTADDPITIKFEWWGDDVRADLTQQAVDLFEKKNEGIKVQTNFYGYAELWESLSGRMASRDLPDVFQMDYPRLRQFAENGMLTPLDDLVDTSDFRDTALLDPGRLNDELVAVPVAANTTGLIYRADWFAEHGIPAPEIGYSWDDYMDTIATLSPALGEGKWAAEDWARSYLYMEMWLRQQGGAFYSEDLKSLGFTKEQLVEYWNMPAALIEQGHIPSADQMAAWAGDGMAEDVVASELRWDSALSGFAPTVADNGGELKLAPPPSVDPENLGIYLKPSMQLVIAANSEYPDAAAKFIEFFLTDPEGVAILGTNRGIPATNAGLENVEIDEISQAILDYEASVKEFIKPAPPVPPAGAGGVEAKYMEIYEQVQYGEMTAPEAADLFFTEAETLFASEQ
ncbi:ABC transporter substrate-binding protein [Glycomyces arizonensis]|uniref:ABC transporter substrate-binding protein n=1 Tax=Glycomyces arizonensis TaxID=256035 RepID=UPI00041D63AB|nr:extracellular solute-binding protein [Glycomyces arizonensis]